MLSYGSLALRSFAEIGRCGQQVLRMPSPPFDQRLVGLESLEFFVDQGTNSIALIGSHCGGDGFQAGLLLFG